jgi:hypothetical protein
LLSMVSRILVSIVHKTVSRPRRSQNFVLALPLESTMKAKEQNKRHRGRKLSNWILQ